MSIYGGCSILEEADIIKNGISYPIIKKDGKIYTYKTIDKSIEDKIDKAISIVKDAFNEVAQSEEFKKCAKSMKENNIFNLTQSSLYKNIDKDFIESETYAINVFIFNDDIDNDVISYKYENNKTLLDITNHAFISTVMPKLKQLGISKISYGKTPNQYYGYDFHVTVFKSDKEAEKNLIEYNNSEAKISV